MAVRITEYLHPRSLREASTILKREGDRAVVVGGGVSMVLSGSPKAVKAVDLSGLGLNTIEHRDAEIRLGGLVTLQELIESPEASGMWGGLLAEACRTAATRPVRNLITIGGNMVQCYYWSTLPPLWLALQAKIRIAGPEKTRTASADDFFRTHPRRFLQPGEIVTRVDLPVPDSKPFRRGHGGLRWGAAFLKFAKTFNDYAMVNACAAVAVGDGRIRKVRLVLGALDILPERCAAAEEALAGKPFDENRAREVCHKAAQAASIRQDFRADADYRRRIAAVFLQRALQTAWQRAAGPST
jgi:CO/xanthine dehydrogenase FAD-binding subunit